MSELFREEIQELQAIHHGYARYHSSLMKLDRFCRMGRSAMYAATGIIELVAVAQSDFPLGLGGLAAFAAATGFDMIHNAADGQILPAELDFRYAESQIRELLGYSPDTTP